MQAVEKLFRHKIVLTCRLVLIIYRDQHAMNGQPGTLLLDIVLGLFRILPTTHRQAKEPEEQEQDQEVTWRQLQVKSKLFFLQRAIWRKTRSALKDNQ